MKSDFWIYWFMRLHILYCDIHLKVLYLKYAENSTHFILEQAKLSHKRMSNVQSQ
jgi:hypothetical protein